MQAQILFKTECILGEGACWHAARNSFYWVDIEGKLLWEYNLSSGKTRSWHYERKISTIVIDQQDNLVIGAQGGVVRFDFRNEQFYWMVSMPLNGPLFRCNDGKCDPSGRLWMGVMHMHEHKKNGALYCISEKGDISLKIPAVSVSNGIVWTADKQRMYFNDTVTGCVQAYKYDDNTGKITFEKKAVILAPQPGSPDGMAIDEEGMLWICHYGGNGVYRWNPQTGQLIDKVDVPAPNVTSCAFGGPDRNMLVITTAREHMSNEQLKAQPLSGSIFTVKTSVKGPVLPHFKG